MLPLHRSGRDALKRRYRDADGNSDDEDEERRKRAKKSINSNPLLGQSGKQLVDFVYEHRDDEGRLMTTKEAFRSVRGFILFIRVGMGGSR